MCGRYTLRTPASKLIEQFALQGPLQLPLRFNIAPSQRIAVVRLSSAGGSSDATGNELCALRWGLVPFWAKNPSIGNQLINARAETVATKPAFRQAFAKRRCLIPADGFFEWQKRGKTRQPYWYRLKDDGLFAFAGLWETWRGGNASSAAPHVAPGTTSSEGFAGESGLETCTIITTQANTLVSAAHDRMPVILGVDDYATWLRANTPQSRLEELLRPFPAEMMQGLAVDQRVNSPAHDDPGCILPAAVQRGLFDDQA